MRDQTSKPEARGPDPLRLEYPQWWPEWQDPALTPPPGGAKPESCIVETPTAIGELDLNGTYVTALMLKRLDASKVQAALPAALEIRPDAATAPVLITVGLEQHVQLIKLPFLMNSSYMEFIVWIPNVWLADPSAGYVGPFIYAPVLYLDKVKPYVGGRFFGYNKVLGRFHANAGDVRVSSLVWNRTMVTGRLEPYGDTGKPHDFRLFDPVRSMLCQPIVSRRVGQLLYTRLGLRLPSSIMQPIRAEMEVAGDVPGLPKGAYAWSGFDQEAEGACRLRSPWHLTAPFLRSAITEKVSARAAASGPV